VLFRSARPLLLTTNCNHRVTAREKTAFWRRTRGCALRCSVGAQLFVIVLIIEASRIACVHAMPDVPADEVLDEKVCDKNATQLELAANHSSRLFSVRALENVRTWCNLSVLWQLSLPRLIQIKDFRLGSSANNSVCNCHHSSPHLLLQVKNSTISVCNATESSALLLWVAVPFNLSFRCTPNKTAVPYSVTLFKDSEVTNICDIRANVTQLKVKHRLCIFASDSRFKTVPPNNITCILPEYSAILQPPSQRNWTLTVLAAPPLDSCWTLLLNGKRRNASDTLSIAARSNVTLLYVNCTNQLSCSKKCRNVEGFTLRVLVAKGEPRLDNERRRPTIGSSAKVTAIVAGSVAAAALLALAIGIATFFFVRRHRRTPKIVRPNAREDTTTAAQSFVVSTLSVREEIVMVDNDLYSVALAT